MKRGLKRLLWAAATVAVLGAAGAAADRGGWTPERLAGLLEHMAEKKQKVERVIPPPAVTVARASERAMVATALVTGTLVPREEILVAPEVEGLRITDIKVDVGDRVSAGQVLAILDNTQLEAQLAQNTAAIARAQAAISQAKSQITQAEAAANEAAAQLERARPLQKSGFLSDSVFDQRQAAARTTAAQLIAARDGLNLAEASKQEAEASRREITWRLDNTKVTAPRAGIISRRTARIGAVAAGVAEPMFRIIAKGEIELDADTTGSSLAQIEPGQSATIEVEGVGKVEGKVRLVSPEVDRNTRLGSVRIFIGDKPGLRIGAFARGRVETARRNALAVPVAAIQYSEEGASVLRVNGNRVASRVVSTRLRSGDWIEIESGLESGDLVVAKAGTFLRDGDSIQPIVPNAKVSEAAQ